MKKLKYVLIILIAIVIWYFIDDARHSKPINAGEQVNTHEVLETGKVSTEKNEEIVEPLFEMPSFSPALNKKTEKETQLTYIQAYRNTIIFKKCSSIINDINKGVSPLIKFKKDASFDLYTFPEESPKQATALQLQYFSEFSHLCQSFLKEGDETYTSALQRQHDIFNSIEPETESEKLLAEGLELYIKYEDIRKSINQATQRYSLLSEEELHNINSELKSLLNQIKDLKANPDWRTNNQIQILINELNVKWSNLYIKIQNNKVTKTDDELKKKIEEQILLHKNKMVKFLKKSNSPDILLLYAKLVFYPTYQSEDPIIKDMKRLLNTYEPYLMLSLYDVGIKLTACAMNYPCDDQSEFILDYCARGFNNMSNYPSACGKTLEDFYFNDYLSPNQLEDVSTYFNYVLENYVK